ncbi:hypothetical protein [Mycolicibacterium sp.]|uniref:hypothetical protein n=1 Tax=Mycolicibacterium sp. TaxID=2320850 RepID=UPI001A2FB97A|nr:hypothetical protein [Mycolicibacterium sp.]MBJ7341194.1 hypothetical protein [Mycolicibacterium sp.]
MKKILGLGAAALIAPAAIASAALLSPGVAAADPSTNNAMNVVGEPYFKAVSILKSQGVRATFGGSFGSDLPQSQCIVSQQKATSKKMILMLDCTQAAGQEAAGNAPSTPGSGVVPGATAPAPGSGQGTYGGPIGVPVPVG